jgi:predicted phage baseplate assembly protein
VGPNGSTSYLFSLPQSEDKGVVWIRQASGLPRPEVRVCEALPEMKVADGEQTWEYRNETEWEWRRSFVGLNSSQPNDCHFMLDDGTWRRVKGYRRAGIDVVHKDYASGLGSAMRFGDGEFGRIPDLNRIFLATYRLGNGRPGNVAADTLSEFQKSNGTASVFDLHFIESVTNPLPAVDGSDPETVDSVRVNAPEAFRAVTYRAVRPEDYAEAAERLSWVQRAGCAFRWTGSWLSAFVTPDPLGATRLSDGQRKDLADQLDRFRQTGRETYPMDPVYADLDLEITICVTPTAYQGEVKERVMAMLFGAGSENGGHGFFGPDNFMFGTPLERSRLEAEIQQVPGVAAVGEITISRRGSFLQRPFTEFSYQPGLNEVIRVENNLDLPGHGSVRINVKGDL